MTARTATRFASLALLVFAAGCTTFYEITVETPIKAKLDTSAFQRVLVVGFVSGGSEDLDANIETVRLLRSQLRTRSSLKVVETDVLPLAEIAWRQAKETGTPPGAAAPLAAVPPAGQPPVAGGLSAQDPGEVPGPIKDEKDLLAYEQVFANVEFWKKLGEEHQSPLIVTGTVLFTPLARSGYVQRDREVIDPYGRHQVESQRTWADRKGFSLSPKFVFIDGRTGTVISSETFHEETLYDSAQNTPPLSSYFELMDRLIPRFLGTLSSQKIRGTRVLLR
jgi:hypothetical protein